MGAEARCEGVPILQTSRLLLRCDKIKRRGWFPHFWGSPLLGIGGITITDFSGEAGVPRRVGTGGYRAIRSFEWTNWRHLFNRGLCDPAAIKRAFNAEARRQDHPLPPASPNGPSRLESWDSRYREEGVSTCRRLGGVGGWLWAERLWPSLRPCLACQGSCNTRIPANLR